MELGSGIFFGQITEQVGIDKAIDATIKGVKIDFERQLLFGRPAAATTAVGFGVAVASRHCPEVSVEANRS